MNGVKAAQACIDRFNGKPYAPGKRDCVKLACHLLHQYGVAVPHTKGVRYSTEAGAIKALRRAGFRDLIEAVDSLGLERIAPARAQAGDLVGLPCDRLGCTLTVAVGNGRVIGFQGGRGCVIQPLKFAAAWRPSWR